MSVVVQVEMGKLLVGFEKNVPLTGMKTCKHNIHLEMQQCESQSSPATAMSPLLFSRQYLPGG